MFIKGFTYGFDGRKGMYRTDEAAASIERLSMLGGDWAALAFVIHQDSFSSTVIRFSLATEKLPLPMLVIPAGITSSSTT